MKVNKMFLQRLSDGKKASVFEFEVRMKMVDSALPALAVEVRGSLKNDGTSVSYSFCMEDVTGGERNRFALLRDGALSMVDNFTLTSSFYEVKSQHSVRDWERVLTIPLNKIQFGRKGIRQLKGSVIVNGGAVSGSTTYDYVQQEAGFENVADEKEGLYSSVFCLICGFRAEHPVQGDEAVRASADWLLAESADWSPLEKERVFERFASLAESIPPVVGWKEACGKYSEPLRTQANTDFRNGIIRLFYSVLIGERDLVREDGELSLFYDLCIAIGAKMNVFSRLTDKLILVCELEKYDQDLLLGIHDGMSVDEMKSHLRDEYKKWNERVTHSDEVVREKAAFMMKRISERRGRLNAVV